ncbi:hypothetical protein BJ508DRAFT_329264 [Ascobolus immersus RN42]|uniref:F-box domain-containing protein n=1 Tax=Ascobolus immersus RN42 TaxID=1160509 RepID=A0A3N4HYR9_ASCIM|nr:hypothetical protein BJ508DRAFT_329264 [Ascobolus immersus RN42]
MSHSVFCSAFWKDLYDSGSRKRKLKAETKKWKKVAGEVNVLLPVTMELSANSLADFINSHINVPPQPPALPSHVSPEMPFYRTLMGQLPLEIRLDIYTICSAFTLLQLFQSCRKIRQELISYPSIIHNSFGYNPVGPIHKSKPPRLTLAAIAAIPPSSLAKLQLYMRFYHIDHLISSKNFQSFTLHRIIHRTNINVYISKRRLVCAKCGLLRLATEFYRAFAGQVVLRNSTERKCVMHYEMCNRCVVWYQLRQREMTVLEPFEEMDFERRKAFFDLLDWEGNIPAAYA